MSGRPEARYEAYARSFAGCGPHTSRAYRRSYGRLYEAISCQNHSMNDKYKLLYKERPFDIVGKHVRLEALECQLHLEEIYKITNGNAVYENKAYDPNDVWGFLQDGPFDTVDKLKESFVFNNKTNEGAFAMVHSITDRIIGVILLTNDDPTNLSIQLEAPIAPPVFDATQQQIESCYLLIDRLFANGYRRIQILIDTQDHDKRKLCMRLGCTLEGILYKHMIIKEASRDSNVYSLLNTDWKRGARNALYKKLYGPTALLADLAHEKAEDEYDEQQRVLAEQKATHDKGLKQTKNSQTNTVIKQQNNGQDLTTQNGKSTKKKKNK